MCTIYIHACVFTYIPQCSRRFRSKPLFSTYFLFLLLPSSPFLTTGPPFLSFFFPAILHSFLYIHSQSPAIASYPFYHRLKYGVRSPKFIYAPCVQLYSLAEIPMDEGIERDNTSGGGGLPTLPGLNLSTIQPSRRGFYRILYMCVRGKITGDYIYRCQSACPVVLNNFDLFKEKKTSQSL